MKKTLLKKYTCILSSSALCILAASSLLGFLGNQSIFLDFFAHPRLQYAWAALLLVIIFVILKKWKFAAATVIVMLFNAALLVNYHHTDRVAQSNKEVYAVPDLRIMSANIFFFNEDYDRIEASIRDANPDVLVLIEISGETFVEMKKRLPEYDKAVFDISPATFGIASFVKAGIDAELSSEYLSSVRSATTIAKVRAKEKNVTVLGVHTVAPTGLVGRVNDRAGEIASYAEYAKQTTDPLVIIGDYNDTTFSPTMKPLWEAGLQDSRERFEFDLSWPLFFPAPFQITIDHALIKNGVRVIERKLGKPTGGDHAPLIVDITI